MDFDEMFDLAMGNSKTHIECPQCNGYGSSLKEANEKCSVCGGSGMIKKEDSK